MNFFLPRTRHPRISVTRLDVTCFQPDAPDTASPRSCILFPALPAPFYWYTDPNVIRFHAAGWTNVNYCWHFRHPRPTYTFTHRIFIDLGIHPKRGIKIDRVPSIDQRKSLVPSIKSSEERNGISPPLPIKINQIFEEEEKGGVRNFGAMRRVCRVAGRSACGRFNSFKIICFLPDPFSRYATCARHIFRELCAPVSARVNAAHHTPRGGQAKYEAYFSLRHFQRKIIALGN